MNIKIYKYILLTGAIAVSACSRDSLNDNAKGYITAFVEQDNAVSLVTKADVTENDPFTIKIYKGNELVQTITDHRTLIDSPLLLNCATYKVTAENRAVAEATFESPRYYGEETAKVLSNTTTSVNITCGISDVIVEPTFTDDFATSFKNYSLTVSNGNASLIWSAAEGTLGQTGYFNPTGTLTWTLSLTNNAGRTFTKTDSYTNVTAKQKYSLNFKIEQSSDGGAAGLRIILDDETSERSFDLLLDFTSSEAEAKSANAWAVFADITGEFKNEAVPDGLKLQYKTAAADDWTDFTGEITTDVDSKSFSARLTGLTPSTMYVVRAVTTKENGKKQISFTTEADAEVHNMSFDAWYTSGKAPMPNQSSDYKVWDSANTATAGLGTIPTQQETSHLAVTGDGKSAAKLETMTAFGILAAGNIYTGAFLKVIGMSGASLEWGTPFTSRPLAMKGWFDYTPKTINMSDNSHSSLEGQPDTCQIQVFLTDRADRFQINTSEGKFVDVTSDDIIAYGKIESGTATSTKSGLTNGYEPFTIKLDYRSTTRKPTQIVIVAAASKYGDYFTGGKGSVLYLDEFSFVYDPAEL